MTDSFLAETTTLLARTPRVLHELLADLPEAWLEGRDTPDGWQPRDVLGHLISAELTDWIPRAEMIMEYGPDRPFEPFDRLAHVERDRDVPMSALLARFAELRAANLGRLGELVTDADLDRSGRHPSLGAVTLRQLLATWAVHDLDHVSQVFAGLSATQDSAVGPWKQYLGILLRRDDPSAVPG
jgi:DinB superfamily